DHRSYPADRLAPARFHVTEHDHAAVAELDDFAGSDIVHELGAGHLALDVFNHGDRGLRRSRPGKTNQTNDRGKYDFHLKAPIRVNCYPGNCGCLAARGESMRLS